MEHSKGWFIFGIILLTVLAIYLLLDKAQARVNDCPTCWSVVDSPNPGDGDNFLNAVAVVSPNYAWAAGYQVVTGTAHPLVLNWNGSSWGVVAAPSPGAGGGNYLTALAVDPRPGGPDPQRQAWAVGYYTSTTISRTMALRWNGSAWSAMSAPNHGSGNNYLTAISVISPTAMWAVGYYVGGGVNKTLVLSSTNGTSWGLVTTPNSSAGNGTLNAVAAISSTSVWAVGYYTSTSGAHGLVLHLDQSGWHTTELNTDPNNLILKGITASPQSAWAVGYGVGSFVNSTALYWDGTSWTHNTSGDDFGIYNGVYRSVSGAAWAVGNHGRFADAPYAKAAYWSGSLWLDSTAQNPVHEDELRAVAGTGSDVWAVGYQRDSSSAAHTLIEHSSTCPNMFVDITGNVFYQAISYLYCQGVVAGTDQTHYQPAGTSTRGQFAKVVTLGFGIPFYTPGTPDFSDVPASYFAYLYIESGYHAAILNGYDAATCQAAGQTPPCYLPNRAITRAELTKLVVAAAHYQLYTPTVPDFSDVPPQNIFFAYIETAAHKGVVNGYPDHTFHPNQNVRRDEMAQIVYKGVTTP